MKYNNEIIKGAKAIRRDAHPIAFPGDYPYEFTSPKEELLACRETAWIGVYLTTGQGEARTDVIGPDAAKLLNMLCVNRDFEKLPVGGSRHALICDENGYIVASGIVTRMGKEHFRTYVLMPWLHIYAENAKKAGFDLEIQDVHEYFFQIDGPKSLEILEEACQCNLHDLKFAQNKTVQFCGTEMYVHRLGMSGALAYEVHGAFENAEMIYNALVEVGKKFGAKQMGIRNYCNNHTSGGYPNQLIHFEYPGSVEMFGLTQTGSASDKVENLYVTPYDVGWGYLVNFEHEFPGKAALQKIAENPEKVPVTLEWDLNDVADVVIGEINGEGVEADEGILEYDNYNPEFRRAHVDYVTVDGENIGVASSRIKDFYYKKFISLAFIKKEYAEEGKTVTVMWGKAGKEQKEIRATVARFPYFNEEFRNETYDVAKIPSRFA